ncbi:hypothetical protein B0T12DRAFT_410812 [Alternaria alternata]|nr:hypothetical protein B0T12DRAFT_410812 [Alternaria alternata]
MIVTTCYCPLFSSFPLGLVPRNLATSRAFERWPGRFQQTRTPCPDRLREEGNTPQRSGLVDLVVTVTVGCVVC